jgi:hypothetical protein
VGKMWVEQVKLPLNEHPHDLPGHAKERSRSLERLGNALLSKPWVQTEGYVGVHGGRKTA